MSTTPAPLARNRIFINYRRDDSEVEVGRLAADLRRVFSADQVFQDVASIDPGADFEDALRQGLQTCAAVLVVIGPRWLVAKDVRGRRRRRRLDLDDDWVRREVAESLNDKAVRVFPVLVGNAGMPGADELPSDIQALARRQAYLVTTRHWAKDVDELVGLLKRVPGLAPPSDTAARRGESGATAGPTSVVERAVAPAAPLAPTLVSRQRKPIAGASFRDGDMCPEMVVIPAGSFTMGSPDNEPGRTSSEGPQHRVTIKRAFAVGRFDVTFEEWDACVIEGGCQHKPEDHGWGRGRRPVMNVSWEDVQTYAAWLSKKTGKAYRLLSEAEWEYAARGGTTTRYSWGDVAGTNLANFRESGSQWSGKQTAPVGSFGANRFGLYDMSGNVWEWTQDCWNENYHGAPVDGKAWQAGDCSRQVLRGGSWDFDPEVARAAGRASSEPANRNIVLGFRLARTL